MTEIDLTLHEERPVVGTSAVPVRRVKLVKRIVTEEVTVNVTVTVAREVVELVELDLPTEPANVVTGTAPLLPGDREVASVVLHEQRPVVVLQTVPVERVSLVVRTIGETQQVEGVRRREVLD